MRFLLALVFCLAFFPAVFAQDSTKKIDHLTVEEDDLVHEAQELDKRIEIFVKAVDRRLMSLTNTPETNKKDAAKYGALPVGTRAELLADINSIIAEAIQKIDDAAERDKKSQTLPKALKTFADNCQRFVVQLRPFNETAKTEAERAAVADAIQNCQEVVEAQKTKGSTEPK